MAHGAPHNSSVLLLDTEQCVGPRNQNLLANPDHTLMRSSHLYWHLYPQDQIKAELRGGLTCVLEVPWVSGSPVLRDIIDPSGCDFPGGCPAHFPTLRHADHHGILYSGVNKMAVFDLMLTDPRMLPDDSDYSLYNRQIISNARNFFLLDPNRGFKAMPHHLVQLL